MNSHALAKILLAGPDVPVIVLEYDKGSFERSEIDEVKVVDADSNPKVLLR